MKDIKVLGIDLAKNVFQLHGINAKSKCSLKKRLNRENLIEFMAQLSPCLVGVEACGGAHYWARMFIEMGHTVKMMAPQFVKPYVKSNKNDANDAEGICEAVTRPNMKFVPVKKIEQQDVLLSHRARELVIKQRTAQANQIRGLLFEYGIVIPLGISHIREMTEVLEKNKLKLTVKSEAIFKRLYEQFKVYDEQVSIYDKEIQQQADSDPMCLEVQKIEGISPLTASAVVASIGDASVFNNGREVSAWLGLVPKQHSSGNKVRLGGISKLGDRYLRTLLIHGARSALTRCESKEDKKNKWAAEVKQRCGFNKAAVALANKNARTIWVLMAHGECYHISNIQESVVA